jgi:pimeloyl-ACP methyl ester carboxylesterase
LADSLKVSIAAPEENVVMEVGNRVSKHFLNDGVDSFEVTVLEAAKPSHVVLFSVGGGGNPERHLPLLTTLADHGCSVAAPHFGRLVSSIPTENDLLLRARRLRLALDHVMRPGLPAAGVGHSIGATMLLALVGAQAKTRAGQCVSITPDTRFDRLVLLAPAIDFFRAPGALDGVRLPILAWAGTKDEITPPAQTEFLNDVMEASAPVEMHIVEGAGHFTFMNNPPPQMTDAFPNRDAFLADLAETTCRFITN